MDGIIRYNDQLPQIGKKPGREKYRFVAKRADANQPSIVSTFRKLGCVVQHLHTVGDGCFDLLIGVDFLNILVEVKDGSKSPSARKYTDDQKRFNFNWTGLRAVATTDYEVTLIVDEARRLVSLFRDAAIDAKIPLSVSGSREFQYRPSLY